MASSRAAGHPVYDDRAKTIPPPMPHPRHREIGTRGSGIGAAALLARGRQLAGEKKEWELGPAPSSTRLYFGKMLPVEALWSSAALEGPSASLDGD